MVDIEIQSKDEPMQWYTGRITAMVQTTEDSSKSVYKVGFVDTEKLCFNLVDHFLAREYPALYPIPNWAPGDTKTTQPDDSPARTGTRGQRKKRGAETSIVLRKLLVTRKRKSPTRRKKPLRMVRRMENRMRMRKSRMNLICVYTQSTVCIKSMNEVNQFCNWNVS